MKLGCRVNSGEVWISNMTADKKFVICIDNADYPASLERWKVYRVVADGKAERR